MIVSFYKRDLSPVIVKNFENYKDILLVDFIKELCQEQENLDKNVYFIDNNKNIKFFIDKKFLIKIINNSLINKKIGEISNFFNINENDENFKTIKLSDNLIYVYNLMRNKYIYLPVVDKENNIIGELYYATISKKFYDILLKDKEINCYNQEFYNLLLKNFEIFENINYGLIVIKPLNLNILYNFYGNKFIKNILKKISIEIEKSLRRIDLIFFFKNLFFIITFNVSNKEILNKIQNRVLNKLNQLDFNKTSLDFIADNIHIPSEEKELYLANDKIIYNINKKTENYLNKI